jgi:uncharacterized protein DUF5335
MPTKEIPRTEWIKFFDEFSKQHQGWVVTVEVLSPEIGDQDEADGSPLVGISADTKDGENRIEIMIGGNAEAHLTRIINSPKRVWVKQPEEEAHEAVEVESDDGTTTILRFRHIPPDEVERLLPDLA